ncbi:MAG: glycosyl hydrolase, partial [Schaalia hyovaginalis]|nr:glycosyl hydrolase [Schaalia hyovaginalis]
EESDSGPLKDSDPLFQMSRAASPLARFGARVLAKKKAKADATGIPDLNINFISNMPFRALGKMSHGLVSLEMVDGLVALVNGRHLKGLGALVGGFFSNRRANRATLRRLDAPHD